MKNIIFVDRNKELVKKVADLFLNTLNYTHCNLIVSDKDDILECKKDYPNAKIVTASNPDFKAGGGLDLVLSNKYPEQWKYAKEFKFTNDLFFVVSCNKNIESNTKIIQRALLGVYFASRKNDIILSGIGTSIGGLDIDLFINQFKLLISADFSNIDFSYVNFIGADFSHTDFSYVNLSNVNFYWADFNHANFNNTNFSNADFNNVNFSNTNFSNADFNNVNFSNADFASTNFNSANFRNVNFSHTDFKNAFFNSSNFNNTDASFCNFKLANFNYTNFSFSSFIRTQFNYSEFCDTNFIYTNFSNSNFNMSNFSDSSFINSNFNYAYFNNTCFTNTNFSYIHFYNNNFVNAYFNYRITPDEGVVIGWKKCLDKIIKLEIIDVKNISGGLIGRKLRTDKTKVLEIQELDGTKSSLTSISSEYDKNFIYTVGKIVQVNDFVKNDKIECAAGIHFFITRDEAVDY